MKLYYGKRLADDTLEEIEIEIPINELLRNDYFKELYCNAYDTVYESFMTDEKPKNKEIDYEYDYDVDKAFEKDLKDLWCDGAYQNALWQDFRQYLPIKENEE